MSMLDLTAETLTNSPALPAPAHRPDRAAKHQRPPSEMTVVVAMSGGVDSSLAAALLVEQGYNCIGVMMRLWAETQPGEGSTNKCCSLESVHDARRVADELRIQFYLFNVAQQYTTK